METIKTDQDIPCLCITVTTFPMGIKEAFDELAEKYGLYQRAFYGISYMDEAGKIIYKAAVAGEPDGSGYEPFTIRSGTYLSEKITDWMSKTDSIKDVFGRMMQTPGWDTSHPVVEWYKDDNEMYCWLRMK